MTPGAQPRTLTETTRTALRAGVAAAMAQALAPLLAAKRPYWMILIAVVVVNDTWGSSLRKTWQRVGMTGAGCAAGWALHFISDGRMALERGLLLLAIFFAAFFRKSSYPWMTFFITVYVAFLFTVMGQWSEALMVARLEDTVLGGAIAIAASLIVPAPRVAGRLEESLSSFWQECRAQVEQGFRILKEGADPEEHWQEGRRSLLRSVERLEAAARESDYEMFLNFRGLQRNRRILRATVLLCHQALGFNRMARQQKEWPTGMEELERETLERFDALKSRKRVEESKQAWPSGAPVFYFGRRVDELLAEIDRDL